MNIAGTQFPVFIPYVNKIAYEIYVSGCDRHCLACHSPEQQDFLYGEKLTEAYTKKLLKKIKGVQELVDIIAVLGGDLLCQNDLEAREFVNLLKNQFPKKGFWLFTGADAAQLPNWTKEMFDAIKTGRYIKELRQEGFPASTNQKLLRKGTDY